MTRWTAVTRQQECWAQLEITAARGTRFPQVPLMWRGLCGWGTIWHQMAGIGVRCGAFGPAVEGNTMPLRGGGRETTVPASLPVGMCPSWVCDACGVEAFKMTRVNSLAGGARLEQAPAVRPPGTALLRRGKNLRGCLFVVLRGVDNGRRRVIDKAAVVLLLAVGQLDEEGRWAARQDCFCSIGSR